MEKLGDNAEVAAKVALGPLWDAFTALELWLASCVSWSLDQAYPSNQDVLRQRRVGVLDLDERKLDSAIGELVYQVEQFALCSCQCTLLRDIHNASPFQHGGVLGPELGWPRYTRPTH